MGVKDQPSCETVAEVLVGDESNNGRLSLTEPELPAQ